MKIVILDKNTVTNGDISLAPILALGDAVCYDMMSEDDIIAAVMDAEVIVCNKSKITERIMDKCKNLKFVTLFATGYNNVDIKAANKRGITVSNVPGYSTDAVAQHTFAFILELSLNISKYNASVMRGDWARQEKFCYFEYPLSELSGKTLGIFGFGAIGKKVAEIGKAFGMRIIAHTRSKRSAEGIEFVDKETLFRESDYLTLHCPLNDETQGLVNKETLKLMKPTAFLINTSRGAVVNEEALSEVLKAGKIAGAAVDVLDIEPMKKGHIYLETPNLLITPHIAWAPNETRERLIALVAENIKAFQNGQAINTVC